MRRIETSRKMGSVIPCQSVLYPSIHLLMSLVPNYGKLGTSSQIISDDEKVWGINGKKNAVESS